MSSAFVSKSRRVRFELTLRIVDLNNVPLVSGTSFIKWHLPSSTSAEHRGRTAKCPIKDHRVRYAYEKQTQVRLVVGKGGQLQETVIDFEVLQDYGGEKLVLGHVHLNLAEYADPAEVGSPGGKEGEGEGVVRRYLMQDSKINSTLKIGIAMRHIEGTREYYAPPLRTAPVFGGIAGIISSSDPVGAASSSNTPAGDGDEAPPQALPPMPNFSSTSKEMGEMQDMYRRTLAAFWASQPGELKADECIEDIFAGGDGWGKGGRPTTSYGQASMGGSGDLTVNGEGEDKVKTAERGHGHRRNFSRLHGRHKMGPRKSPGELDEMDVREDLVGWQIGAKATS